MFGKVETPARPVRRPRFAVLLTAALVGGFAAAHVDAEQISRPIRDTSDRSLTSTGKVLVAVPTAELDHYPHLYRATRGYHGYPVRCGDTRLHDLHDTTYVVKRLPTRYRYDSTYKVCNYRKPGWATSYGGGHTTTNVTHVHVEGDRAHAPTPTVMPGPITVIASGSTKLGDLPAAMRSNPWALLHNGRYRDARGVFEKQMAESATVSNQAGLALAMAMSGDLDGGADALAALNAGADLRSLPVKPDLAAKLTALADTLYADRPDAQRALRAMAGAGAPGSA